jgi:hypothetical protein
MRRFIATSVVALSFVITAAPATAKVDKDCSDFPTQKAAQKWFMHHNPKADPSRLDADHDGIACEDNP